MDKQSKEVIAKQVGEYFKLMQKKLKEWHGKGVKSPFQLEKKDRKQFFKKIKDVWKGEKKQVEKGDKKVDEKEDKVEAKKDKKKK